MSLNIKLAGILGGILLVVMIFILIFAKEQLFVVTNTLIWGFEVLGVILGDFILKAQNPKQKKNYASFIKV